VSLAHADYRSISYAPRPARQASSTPSAPSASKDNCHQEEAKGYHYQEESFEEEVL